MIAYLFLLLISYDIFAETRQKIVVIDTGVSIALSKKSFMCEDGLKGTYAGSWIDTHGHGTNVIGLIADKINPKKMCIVSIKLNIPKGLDPEIFINRAMRLAEDEAPVAINISMSGNAHFRSELNSFLRLIRSGTKIIVAAGNDSLDLDKTGCYIYPACYLSDMKKIRAVGTKNFIVVGARDTGSSNFGSVVTAIAKGKNQGFPKMSGTSQATANFTGSLFYKK